MDSTANTSLVEVTFKVELSCGFGEEVRVCGNVPILGNNDPNRAIGMVTSPQKYPLWTTKNGLFLPGAANTVTYRYCLFSGGVFQRWEGVERCLAGPKQGNISMADIFGTAPTEPTETSRDSESKEVLSALSAKLLSGKSLLKTSVTTSSETKSFRDRQFIEWNRQQTEKPAFPSAVIVVSYFLPVVLTKISGTWTATWDAENILTMQHTSLRVSWVGTVRYNGGTIPPEDEDAISIVLARMNCYPIFFSSATHHQFYDIYCKQILWPMMHHVADVYGPLHQHAAGRAQKELWIIYTTVNRLFKNKVMEIYQPSDTIWIHGFHLMLLPLGLRRTLPLMKIGFYLHTPFPSSEIWRTIARRNELLLGMLNADQIGFHLFEYSRHFLTTCRRLLGFAYDVNTAGQLSIHVDHREVCISCMHVGVNMESVQSEIRAKSSEECDALKKHYGIRTVIAGIDKLERLKGIPLKLTAIELFLDENPHLIGKVCFALVGISAPERGDDYLQTQYDVKQTTQRLNAKYLSAANVKPVVYFEEKSESEFSLSHRIAFYQASHIFMSTAPRDGLNRHSMEFTLAKEDKLLDPSVVSDKGEGVVILSEFVSCARVMRGSLIVNPWRLCEVISAIKEALNMPRKMRLERFERNLSISHATTTVSWAATVLTNLAAVQRSDNLSDYRTFGFGMGLKVMGIKAGFEALDVTAVGKSYRSSHHRLILLDWGGTLVAESDKVDNLQAYVLATGQATRTGPTVALRRSLETLCADPRNTVFVVSGKDLYAVSDFFGEVRGLGLGAEHGYFFRWPQTSDMRSPKKLASAANVGRWETMFPMGDQAWKELCLMVMDIFAQRTQGAYIEKKGNALIWQFRDADPEFGYMQSKELEEHLADLMSGYTVEVLRGGGMSDGYIEVRPRGVSKGLFLEHAIGVMKQKFNVTVDFILTVGDDASDEPMFEQTARLGECSHVHGAYSVTVGRRPTAASAYLDDPDAVMQLVSSLAKVSSRGGSMTGKKYLSSADLSLMTTSTKPPARPLSMPSSRVSNLTRSNSAGALVTNPDSEEQLQKDRRKLVTIQESHGSGDDVTDGTGAVKGIGQRLLSPPPGHLQDRNYYADMGVVMEGDYISEDSSEGYYLDEDEEKLDKRPDEDEDGIFF